MKIVHCSSEVTPFSKTGGLADVSSSLPKALALLGNDVIVITPFYETVLRAGYQICSTQFHVETDIGGRREEFGIFESYLSEKCRVLFLSNPKFFHREELYGKGIEDYADNYLRFSHFSLGALKLAQRLAADVIHCHDWQTGLVAAYNKFYFQGQFPIVFTIHNLAYQGLFAPEVMPEIGLSWDIFNPEGIEFWGKVNFLKCGILYSDMITTVSPRYAREITTPEFGCGLDGLLRKRSDVLFGVLNGVDYSEWSPEKDGFITSRYSINDMRGKTECRKDLLEEMGIVDSGQPVFGVIGRMTEQKGFNLIVSSMPEITKRGGIIVVLGKGDEVIEEACISAKSSNPNQVAVKIGHDNALAHKIEAGADFFVMPSRFEPCGLNQMYSLRYGTIPIVHAVGGLDDSIIDIDEDPERGNGIKFRRFDLEGIISGIDRGFRLWADKERFRGVQRRGMQADFSWDVSARLYCDLYYKAIENHRG